jgi:two-component SAPR family response regulator
LGGKRTLPVVEEVETSAAPEVRVLGVVRVDGITGQFPESKCLELVAYLALHRHGVESDTIKEALYPRRPPSPRRLTDLLNRARRTLGNDPEGNPYVPYHQAGLYKVNPHLRSDLDRFTAHIRAADQPDDDSIPHLQAALELVDNAPFSGTKKAYAWAHAEGITTHAIVAVDDAAHRLARLSLETNQPELATWAARKGLTASWACEECYRNLMRAAITHNDTRALDAIYDELNALADHEEGPDATDWLDPETIDLYQSHRQRRRQVG